MVSNAFSVLLKLLVIAINAVAIMAGFVCFAFAVGETWLLSTYSGSYIVIFPLIPLVADIIYLVWVIWRIAVRAERRATYKPKSWLPTLVGLFVVVLYNYLLYAFIASWHL